MRILVTNDDGIEAVGLKMLEEALSTFGDVVVVAPDRERSGAGHSLTLHRPLRIHLRGTRRYAIDGTPTDCVNMAVKGILKDEAPAIVVSGINQGANLGDDITYSGTVCAALEGALLGIPSIAISLILANSDSPNFKPAAHFARRIVGHALKHGMPKDTVLNVNVPNVKGDVIDAYEVTHTGKRRYADAVEEKVDPRGRKYYWIGGEELDFEDTAGSDCRAVREGRVSITPIRLDWTHHEHLSLFKAWQL